MKAGHWIGRGSTRCGFVASLGILLSLGMVLPEPASAYRTTADVEERIDQSRLTWRSGPVSLYVDDEGATGHPIHAWDVFRRSRATWNEVACSSAELALASSEGSGGSGDGHNSITWRRWEWEEAGLPADAAGVTDVTFQRDESGTWWLTEADVLLNARDFDWSDETGEPDSELRSVEAVLTHELGHVLGLAHEPDVDEATMFPTYTGPEQATLSMDDRMGVCHLYPREECDETCAATEACVDGVCEPTCGSQVCRGDAECVDQACKCAGRTCGDDEVCRDGYCVAPCTSESCVNSCSDDADCGGEYHCAEAERRCIPDAAPACASDADCGGSACIVDPAPGQGYAEPYCAECEPARPCPDGKSCERGRCVRARPQLGDRCDDASTCGTGLRCASGICAASCGGAEDCAPEQSCAVGPDGRGGCVSAGAENGAPCESGADCHTGLCIVGGGSGSHCTRQCSQARPCLDGSECLEVSGRQVCLAAAGGSGGCAVSSGRSVPVAFVSILLASVCVFRRRGCR